MTLVWMYHLLLYVTTGASRLPPLSGLRKLLKLPIVWRHKTGLKRLILRRSLLSSIWIGFAIPRLSFLLNYSIYMDRAIPYPRPAPVACLPFDFLSSAYRMLVRLSSLSL